MQNDVILQNCSLLSLGRITARLERIRRRKQRNICHIMAPYEEDFDGRIKVRRYAAMERPA